jgi:hypothetical protein
MYIYAGIRTDTRQKTQQIRTQGQYLTNKLGLK